MVRLALRPAVSKMSHILSFPIDYHVTTKIAKNSKYQIYYSFKKIKISNFTLLLTTLVEALTRSIHDFGSKSYVLYQRRCRLKLLLSYGPMLAKTKKKRLSKIQNFKFHNSLNNFGRDLLQ